MKDLNFYSFETRHRGKCTVCDGCCFYSVAHKKKIFMNFLTNISLICLISLSLNTINHHFYYSNKQTSDVQKNYPTLILFTNFMM